MNKIFKNIVSGILILTVIVTVIGFNAHHHLCLSSGKHTVSLLEKKVCDIDSEKKSCCSETLDDFNKNIQADDCCNTDKKTKDYEKSCSTIEIETVNQEQSCCSSDEPIKSHCIELAKIERTNNELIKKVNCCSLFTELISFDLSFYITKAQFPYFSIDYHFEFYTDTFNCYVDNYFKTIKNYSRKLLKIPIIAIIEFIHNSAGTYNSDSHH